MLVLRAVAAVVALLSLAAANEDVVQLTFGNFGKHVWASQFPWVVALDAGTGLVF